MEPLRARIGTLVGVLLLAGCGGTTVTPTADVGGRSADTEIAAETETHPRGRGVVVGEKPLEDKDALRLFRENVPFVADTDEEEIAELAEEICAYWEDVPSDGDVEQAAVRLSRDLRDRGMAEGEARAAPVFATAWKCPEQYRRSSVFD